MFDLIEIIRKYNKKNKIQKLYYVIEFVTLFFSFFETHYWLSISWLVYHIKSTYYMSMLNKLFVATFFYLIPGICCCSYSVPKQLWFTRSWRSWYLTERGSVKVERFSGAIQLFPGEDGDTSCGSKAVWDHANTILRTWENRKGTVLGGSSENMPTLWLCDTVTFFGQIFCVSNVYWQVKLLTSCYYL